MTLLIALTSLVAVIAVAFVTLKLVASMSTMIELSRRGSSELSREAFERAMEGFASVHERVTRENNATLERIVDLVHGPAASEPLPDEPEVDSRTENLPPWYQEPGDEEGEDWTEGFVDDPVNVEVERESAVMVRPGDGRVGL